MILKINTIKDDNSKIELCLVDNDRLIAKKSVSARFKQGKKLLNALDVMLLRAKLKLDAIDEIQVVNSGGSFSSLRIGIVTANALAYALNIDVAPMDNKTAGIKKTGKIKIVIPEYSAEPNITQSKNKHNM